MRDINKRLKTDVYNYYIRACTEIGGCTLKEVAEHFEISTATVSIILTEKLKKNE